MGQESTHDFFGKDGFGDFVYPNAPHPKDYVIDEIAAIALINLVNRNPGIYIYIYIYARFHNLILK